MTAGSVTKPMRLNINMAHCLLGHWNEDSMRKTARELGWVMTRGVLKPCKHCVQSKARQKNVQKESNMPKTDICGHRIYLDLSKVKIKTEETSDTTINHVY